jgi:hypothetical protein
LDYFCLHVSLRVVKEALPSELAAFCQDRYFVAVFFKDYPVRDFLKVLVGVLVKESGVDLDWISCSGHNKRLERDKEARLLALEICRRRLCPPCANAPGSAGTTTIMATKDGTITLGERSYETKASLKIENHITVYIGYFARASNTINTRSWRAVLSDG